MKKGKKRLVSEAKLSLKTTVEEAESKKQIMQRMNLTFRQATNLLVEWDAQGILRSQRVRCRGTGGISASTIAYWLET